MKQETNTEEWWTEEREQRWERMDEIRATVEEQFNRYRDGRTWVSIHTSAPNPHGVSADSTPDNWYWTVSDASADIEKVEGLLNKLLDSNIDVRERPDGWAGGYWLVVESE